MIRAELVENVLDFMQPPFAGNSLTKLSTPHPNTSEVEVLLTRRSPCTGAPTIDRLHDTSWTLADSSAPAVDISGRSSQRALRRIQNMSENV